MHTETNVFEASEAPAWLMETVDKRILMRKDRVPVLGFTGYSLIDQVDWHIELAEVKGIVNECGLFDVNRKARPVALAYREFLKQFGQITRVPYGEMFEITRRRAHLKVEV
jgi:hypothetical protein